MSSSIEYEFYKQRSHYKKNCKQKKEKAFIFYFKINFEIKQWLRSLVFFARSFLVSSDRLASIKRRICFTSSWTSSIRPMSLCLGEGYKVEKSPIWRGGGWRCYWCYSKFYFLSLPKIFSALFHIFQIILNCWEYF